MLQPVRIGIHIGSADPYWVQMREAVTRQAQQRELALLPVQFSASMRSVEGQTALFEKLLAQKLDVLICSDLLDALAYWVLDSGFAIIRALFPNGCTAAPRPC